MRSRVTSRAVVDALVSVDERMIRDHEIAEDRNRRPNSIKMETQQRAVRVRCNR